MMSIDSKNPRQIFLAAVKLASDQRESYVVEACAGDEALRQRVAELLEIARGNRKLPRCGSCHD